MHVAFDIGNVLCEVNLELFTQKLKEFIPPENDPMLFLEYLQNMQDIGATTIRKSLRHHHGINNENLEYLIEAWNSTVKPNEMMLNFLDNLKSEHVKIALLSNMGHEHAEYLKRICPRLFKNNIEHLSYQVGAAKPAKLYFQSFLIDNPEFQGAIFIDDRSENLKSAKGYHFKTYKFCLDAMLSLPQAKQRLELIKIRSYIINRKYDLFPNGPKSDWIPLDDDILE